MASASCSSPTRPSLHIFLSDYPSDTTNSAYSAYEHSLLTSSSPTFANQALPTDITIETLSSILILCAGIVMGSPELKPIAWSVWAKDAEAEEKNMDRRRERLGTGTDVQGSVGNPFSGLEERRGFVDIRKKRKEFADWVRDGGGAQASKS